MSDPNFERSPILVFWETTKACELACRHCRAEAIAQPLPGELSTAEGERMIDELRGFAPRMPVLIFTGGDPFMRADLFDLARRARGNGLPIGFAPSVTPRLTRDAADRMLAAGAKTVSVSLDGATAQTHEGIRSVPGHFAKTLEAIRMLVDRGVTVQVNTTLMKGNIEEAPGVAALVKDLGAHIWEVFFLIKVGRGSELAELSPQENEDVSHFLFEASRYGFIVRTVEGPFFRRVVAWRREAEADGGGSPAAVGHLPTGPLYARLSAELRERLGPPTGAPKAQSAGTRDGKGILFVSHDGEVYPSGFLPRSVGNVRERNIVDMYRDDPLLRAIRASDFGGRCGPCPFADACGGSRARAFAWSGDALGEDPGCAYVPVPASA